MGETLAKAGCACGWTVEGPQDVVVDAVIEHGQKLHNMVATREDVLRQLRGEHDQADVPA